MTKRRCFSKRTELRTSLSVERIGDALHFSIGAQEPGEPVWASVVVSRRAEMEPYLIEPDAIVIPDEQVSFGYDYPLRAAVRFEHTVPGGFSRRTIYRLAFEDYSRIYAEENAAVGDPGTIAEATGGKCGLVNRAPSAGPHGIWGHYMSDLAIEGCCYDMKHKVLRFSIGS